MGKKARKNKKSKPTNYNLYLCVFCLLIVAIFFMLIIRTANLNKKLAPITTLKFAQEEVVTHTKDLNAKVNKYELVRIQAERELMALSHSSPSIKRLLSYYAKHRNIGFLEKVREPGKYASIFWYESDSQQRFSLVIVPKELEAKLKANLLTPVEKFDSQGRPYAGLAQIPSGGSYDPINKVLFLFESSLEDKDRLYGNISFLHEMFHAKTHLEGKAQFGTLEQITAAELMAHRYIAIILNELTNGWYKQKTIERAEWLKKTHPRFYEDNLQIDSGLISGDLDDQMKKKIGNAGHFQYILDIMDQWTLLELPDKTSRENYLHNLYKSRLSLEAQ